MLVECTNVKASFVVKGEKTEGVPHDAKGLTVRKLYGNVGHAHPSPGETS